MNLTETQFGTYGDQLVRDFFDNAITDAHTLSVKYRQLCREVHPDYAQMPDANDVTSGLNAAREFIEQQLSKSVSTVDESLLPRKARSQLAMIRRRCNKELHYEERRYLRELKKSDRVGDLHDKHYENEEQIRRQYDHQARSVLISCTC